MFALFLPALMGYLAAAMAGFVGRAIIAAGVGFVTYTGISLAVSSMKSSVVSGVGSIGGDALQLIGYLWLDRALTVVMSAVVTALAMKALTNTVKKVVLK